MGILDKLAAAGKNILADAERQFGRVSDRATFERVCQAAFLIARADGSFGTAEKSTLQRVISAKLPHFKAADILAALTAAEGELAFTAEGGTQMLLANIAKAGGTDQAPLIMMVAVAIGAADGDFDADEKAVARKIADALAVEPGCYGL